MGNFIESVRKALLEWNVAPLSVVAFLCYIVYSLIEFYKVTACTMDPVSQGAIFVFLGGVVGILYKMYASMQLNRKEDDKEDE